MRLPHNLNDRLYKIDEAVKFIYSKYSDDYDSISEVYDIACTMQEIYNKGGVEALKNEFFTSSATAEYMQDYNTLVCK